MGTCLQIGLTNALWAAVLAIFVAAITRLWRNPHLAHALWLIVLLRLVAPPVFQVPLQTPAWLTRATIDLTRPTSPELASVERPPQRQFAANVPKSPSKQVVSAGDITHPSAVQTPTMSAPLDLPQKSLTASTTESLTPPGPETPTPVARSISPLDVGGGLWVFGTAVYLAVTVVRVRRFGRAIKRFRSPTHEWLFDEITELSRVVGLRRSPRLAVVEAALSPMVWSGWRPTLLVPKTIVDSLDPSRRRLLLLHELWHVRRGDHRTRWFAVAVLALYWWNPVAWWAVRRLQNAEEECCDAAVLSLEPQPETYGEALLAVSELVSCGSLPAAAVSIGVERQNHLKRRMTMILTGSRWRKLTKAPLAAVLASAVLIVGLSLTFAASQTEPPTESNARVQAPPQTTPATLRQSGQAAVHPATLATNSQLDPKRPQGAETKRATETLPEWMTAQPVARSGDDEWHKLLNERYNSALKSLQAHVGRIEIDPNIAVTPVIAAARALLDAEVAITATADTLTVYQRYVEFLRYFDDRIGKRWAAKTVGADEFNAVHEARLDAEIKLRSHRVFRAAPAWLTAKALESASGDDELRKLLKDRYNSALKALHALLAQIEIDSNPRVTPVLAAARTLRDDERAIAPGAYQHYVEFLDYFGGLATRHPFAKGKYIGADEWNALVFAQKDAGPMRRSFSAQQSPARSTPSTTDRTKSLSAGQPTMAAPEPDLLKAKSLEPAPGDPPMQKLLKDRYNAALDYLRQSYQRFQIPPELVSNSPSAVQAFYGSVGTNVYDAARRFVDAELALSADPSGATGVRERYLQFTQVFEARVKQLAATHQIGQEFLDAAHEARLDAEIKLLQARSVTQVNPRTQAPESTRAKQEIAASAERSKHKIQALEANVRIANAEFHAAQAGVGQAEAELRRAQANFTFHNRNLERLQKRPKAEVPQRDLDEARRDCDVDEANIEVAKAALLAAQAQVEIKRAQLEKAEAEFAEGKASLEK